MTTLLIRSLLVGVFLFVVGCTEEPSVSPLPAPDTVSVYEQPNMPISYPLGQWFSLHPTLGDIMYVGGEGGMVYISTDGGSRTSRKTEIRSDGASIWMRYYDPYNRRDGSHETFYGKVTDSVTWTGTTLYNGSIRSTIWKRAK